MAAHGLGQSGVEQRLDLGGVGFAVRRRRGAGAQGALDQAGAGAGRGGLAGALVGRAQQLQAFLAFQPQTGAGGMLDFQFVPERLPAVVPGGHLERVRADAVGPETGGPAVIADRNQWHGAPGGFVVGAPAQLGREPVMAVHENVGLDLHGIMHAAFDGEGAAVDRGHDLFDGDTGLAGAVAARRRSRRGRAGRQAHGRGWRQLVAGAGGGR